MKQLFQSICQKVKEILHIGESLKNKLQLKCDQRNQGCEVMFSIFKNSNYVTIVKSILVQKQIRFFNFICSIIMNLNAIHQSIIMLHKTKMNQKEIANMLEVSQSTVSKIIQRDKSRADSCKSVSDASIA